ncbi:hypothetical protein RDWZM_001099 [Blomia tropicalis]|uniref:Protein kinase domain-containing protein n=1 Tax=Blomia tropicalis TaxID=40697 RepID=A0A9Q0MBF2_BLOTA|nr:Protein kinase [Blomia tropicalis]KAJ6222554.1 hypothetical protein RDWZM_001099 [Blomia tropicalis]
MSRQCSKRPFSSNSSDSVTTSCFSVQSNANLSLTSEVKSSNSTKASSHAVLMPINLEVTSFSEPDMVAMKQTLGAKNMSTLTEVNDKGFEILSKIATKGIDEYYRAICRDKKGVCKRIDLTKCSERYRKTLLDDSLHIERYFGGSDGKARWPMFIAVYDIFLVEQTLLYFIEHVNGKSLFVCMKNKLITPESARTLTIQLLKAIEQMQKLAVAHRELTAHNIILNANDQVKITGMSRSVVYWQPDCSLFQKPECRLRIYSHLPPECFCGTPYDPSKVDIWSIGVLMVAINTSRLPFDVTSGFKFSAQWRQFVTIHPTNRFLRAACNKVFCINPVKRITATKFLEHPYFTTEVKNLNTKGLKTSIDPKHQPELFAGVDPSIHIQNGQVCSGYQMSENVVSSSVIVIPKKNVSSISRSNQSSLKPSKSGWPTSVNCSQYSSSASVIDINDPGSDMASGNEGGSATEELTNAELEVESNKRMSAMEESESCASPVMVWKTEKISKKN